MTTANAPVNLDETSKAMATAKQRHPAKGAAAKKAPATVTEMAPKLRWTLDGERDDKNRVAQSAVSAAGHAYAITGEGDVWKATVKVGSKTTVLAEAVSHGRAYGVCVAHHRTGGTK